MTISRVILTAESSAVDYWFDALSSEWSLSKTTMNKPSQPAVAGPLVEGGTSYFRQYMCIDSVREVRYQVVTNTNCTNILFRDICEYVSTLGHFRAHGSCSSACICQADQLPTLSHCAPTNISLHWALNQNLYLYCSCWSHNRKWSPLLAGK